MNSKPPASRPGDRSPSGEETGGHDSELPPPIGSWHDQYPWAVFVVPFIAFMLLAKIEPLGAYPVMYSIRIAIVILIMLVLLAGYRQFPFKVSLLAVAVGVVGAVVWIGLCRLDLEQRFLVPLGLGKFLGLGERAAYNPLAAFQDNVPWMVGFLLIRFTGLAVIVPVIEEFFLRGFLMRYVVDMYWEKVPFGQANRTAIIVATVYGMLSHPAELLAAAAWFSLVTWQMLKTRNIWDCVMAHAVTNLLLGIYVLSTGHWELW